MSIITLARPCSFLHPALVRIRTSVQLKLEGIFILTMKTIKKIPTAKTADQIHSFRDFKSSLSLASFFEANAHHRREQKDAPPDKPSVMTMPICIARMKHKIDFIISFLRAINNLPPCL